MRRSWLCSTHPRRWRSDPLRLGRGNCSSRQSQPAHVELLDLLLRSFRGYPCGGGLWRRRFRCAALFIHGSFGLCPHGSAAVSSAGRRLPARRNTKQGRGEPAGKREWEARSVPATSTGVLDPGSDLRIGHWLPAGATYGQKRFDSRILRSAPYLVGCSLGMKVMLHNGCNRVVSILLYSARATASRYGVAHPPHYRTAAQRHKQWC